MSAEDIIFEDVVLTISKRPSFPRRTIWQHPYEPKKGLSREFLAYFAETLNDVATEGLSDLMDFLADDRSRLGSDLGCACFEKAEPTCKKPNFWLSEVLMVHEMLLAGRREVGI